MFPLPNWASPANRARPSPAQRRVTPDLPSDSRARTTPPPLPWPSRRPPGAASPCPLRHATAPPPSFKGRGRPPSPLISAAASRSSRRSPLLPRRSLPHRRPAPFRHRRSSPLLPEPPAATRSANHRRRWFFPQNRRAGQTGINRRNPIRFF